MRPDQLVVSALQVCAAARSLVLVHNHVPCCIWWCHRVGADQFVESVFRPDQLVGPACAGLSESALWPDHLLCLFAFLCDCEIGIRMIRQTCVAWINISVSAFRFNVIVWMSLRFGQTFMSLFG